MKTEVRNEIKPFRIEWKWINNIPKLMRHNADNAKKKIHRNKCLIMAHLKALEVKEEIVSKSCRWQIIIKLWAKINTQNQ